MDGMTPLEQTRRPVWQWLFRIVVLITLSAGAWAADQKPAYVAGEVLVKFRDHADVTVLPLAIKSTVLAPSTVQGLRLVQLARGVSVEAAVAELRARPDVEYAEPNFIVRKVAVPNDPLLGQQWALTRIDAASAWGQQTGSSGVIVAVMDSGVDYTHPDLVANLWHNPGEFGGVAGADDDNNDVIDDIYGVNYNIAADPGETETGDPLDDDTDASHGTAVSGIIGAVGNNDEGIVGVNWTTRLMAVKFLQGPVGEGAVSDAIKGVDYAIAEGAKIINMSFAAPEYSQFLEDAIERADAAGVLVVSAAGNGIEQPPDSGNFVAVDLDVTSVSPASLKTANNITVAGSTSDDGLWSQSNYGDATVDLAAPGGSSVASVLSTVSPIVELGNYAYLVGTSMSAPHVSGIAALIWSEYPALSHYEVKARILNSVDALPDFTNTTITGGRANAYKALTDAPLPAVFKVTPGTVTAGGQVTVIGANFGAAAGTLAVGGTALSVVSWDSSGERIVATVPATAASGRVQVNGQGSSFPLVVNPPPPPSSDGGDGGGGCFIATAAYGSPLHPKVALLRRFRDEFLLTNAVGRALVKVYYRLSPPLAGLIRESPRLKQAAVWALTPVVAGAERLLAMSDRPSEEDQAEDIGVLVRFKADVPETRRLAIIQEVDAELVEVLPQAGLYHLRLRTGEEVDDAIRQLLQMEEVDSAEPNWRARKSR